MDGDLYITQTYTDKTAQGSHKSHNALNIYPTMHQFVTEMCTHVHISVTQWCNVTYGLVHCGIRAMSLQHTALIFFSKKRVNDQYAGR